MTDNSTPEHLLARILQVAQLLLDTESSGIENALQPSAQPTSPSIINGKEYSEENGVKKPCEPETL